jgi:hypothetical protein
MIPGKHCDIITYLAKRTRAQSGECAEVQIPDYGTELWSPGSRNFSRKALQFQNLSKKRVGAQSCACAEVQFPEYGTVLWSPSREMVPGNTAISAPILPREREISLAHAQRCRFLIMEQYCGHLAVEFIPGNHCDFRTYLTKRARTKSGACTEVQIPDYVTELWSPGSRNCSRKALRFQHITCQECDSSVCSIRRGAVS